MNDFVRREALLNLSAYVDFDGATNTSYSKAIKSSILLDNGVSDGLGKVGIHFEKKIDAIMPIFVFGRPNIVVVVHALQPPDSTRNDVDESLVVFATGEATEMRPLSTGNEGMRREAYPRHPPPADIVDVDTIPVCAGGHQTLHRLRLYAGIDDKRGRNKTVMVPAVLSHPVA